MKRVLAGVLLAVIIFFYIAMPVAALVDQPDSTPGVTIYNYRNLRESGDWLVYLYFNIPYTTAPTDPVSDTYIWSLNNGATEYGRTRGYAYNIAGYYEENGYGYGVASMYFDAANVTAQGMVWGSSYNVKLTQSPAHFASPQIFNYTVGPSTYSTITLQSATQQELADRIITTAADLDTRWTLGGLVSLIEEGETGTILSVYGEAYFRGTIYGVQAMAPQVFASVIEPIYYTNRTWTSNYTANIENQYAGTWVETSQEAGKALFGTTYDLLTVIVVVIMAIGLVAANVYLAAELWAALMDIGILLVFAAKLGLVPFLFVMLIAALAWFYISTRLWSRIIPT